MSIPKLFFKGIASITLVILLSTFMACTNHKETNNQAAKDVEITHEGPHAEFAKHTHDFGKILSGEQVAYNFRFTNTGNQPLVITGVRSGCGCTVPDYPRTPIVPGEIGSVSVVFNSAGRKGMQAETVRVMTNEEQSLITLRIQAEVIEQ